MLVSLSLVIYAKQNETYQLLLGQDYSSLEFAVQFSCQAASPTEPVEPIRKDLSSFEIRPSSTHALAPVKLIITHTILAACSQGSTEQA